MQKLDWVGQVYSNSVAQELLLRFEPTAAGLQARGFEAQKGPQGAAGVVALGFCFADLSFFTPQ